MPSFVESLKLAVPLTEAMANNMERIAAANGSLANIAPGSPATVVIGMGDGTGGGSGMAYGQNPDGGVRRIGSGAGSSGSGQRIGSGAGSRGGGKRIGSDAGSGDSGDFKYNPAANDFIRSQLFPGSRDGAAIVGALATLGDRIEKAMNGGGLGRYFRATGGL